MHIDTDMGEAERRKLLGYKADQNRACCQTCTFSSLATAPLIEKFGTRSVQCTLGEFMVERSGLCYSWKAMS